MPASGLISVTFQENTAPTSNSRGQATENWVTLPGLSNVSAKFRWRSPQFAYDPVGGGQRLVSTGIIIMEPPVAALNEFIVNGNQCAIINGIETWKINQARTYDVTQQLDVEDISGQ